MPRKRTRQSPALTMSTRPRVLPSLLDFRKFPYVGARLSPLRGLSPVMQSRGLCQVGPTLQEAPAVPLTPVHESWHARPICDAPALRASRIDMVYQRVSVRNSLAAP